MIPLPIKGKGMQAREGEPGGEKEARADFSKVEREFS